MVSDPAQRQDSPIPVRFTEQQIELIDRLAQRWRIGREAAVSRTVAGAVEASRNTRHGHGDRPAGWTTVGDRGSLE